MLEADIRSLEDVRRLLRALPPGDAAAADRVRRRERLLTKPEGALGRLEGLSAWLAAWQGRSPPRLERIRAVVFAGNHGIAARGVSAYPTAVTAQMVANFEAGGAAINQLCRVSGIALAVIALDLDRPTQDFSDAPAMEDGECAAAVARGCAAVGAGTDLLCLGEMGIGNTTAAAALAYALYGGTAAAWTGAGTGVVGEVLERKRRLVAAAGDRHRSQAADALDLLRRLGGREMAAIAGAILAARLNRVPVILDGYVACAAAAPLAAMEAGALDHCQVGHLSAEGGHRLLLQRLAMRPLLDLGLRLGEASGAALAVSVIRGALACHLGMATFAEAGVADKDREDRADSA